ncbi:hypothetical protein HDU78_009099, partial [Chytriomyces hyalinus]
KEESPSCHEIQTILYATEDGFVNPKKNPPKLAPITTTVPKVLAATTPKTTSTATTAAPNQFPVAYSSTDSVTSDGRRVSASQSAIVDRHRASLSRLAAASSFYVPPTAPDISDAAECAGFESNPAEPTSSDTSIAASDIPTPAKPRSRQSSRPASAALRSSLRKSLGDANAENQMAKVMETPPALPTISRNSVADKYQQQQQQQQEEEGDGGLEDASRFSAVDATEVAPSQERVSISSDLISYGTTMGE